MIGPDWIAEIKNTFDMYDCSAVAGKIIPIWEGHKPKWYVDPPWYEGIGKCKIGGPIVEFDLGEEHCQIQWPPPGPISHSGKKYLASMGYSELISGLILII